MTELSNNLSDYIVTYKNAIAPNLREQMLYDISQVEESLFTDAKVGKGSIINKEIRDVNDLNLSNSKELGHWDSLLFNIFGKYSKFYFRECFAKHYKLFDADFGDEGYSLLKYSVNQKYEYHADWHVASNSNRFLSGVLYLNDDYEGGEIEFACGKIYKPEAGSIILFPSYPLFLHKSCPIIKGTKYAIVTWFTSIQG